MNEPTLLGLVHNASLLLAIVLLFDLVVGNRRIGEVKYFQVLLGIPVGIVGVIVMSTPWVLVPGIIFDTRSVLLSLSGLFFGAIPTVIAIVITATYRIYQGGAATAMGVCVIITSGAIGIWYRYAFKKPLDSITWWELYRFGLLVHIVMLACTFVLPLTTVFQILSNIAIPVMVMYPIGTILIGSLMASRLRREHIADELSSTEARMRNLVEILQHSDESVQEFLDFALEKATHLTESEIGYIFYYSEDTQQLTLGAIFSNPQFETPLLKPDRTLNLQDTNLWGESIRQRKPLIINDFLADPHPKRKRPPGHASMSRFLSLPVFRQNKIVAVIGVANKATDYTERDVLQLTLLMDGVWKATERRQAEEALRQSDERYKAIVTNLPNVIISIFDRDLRYVITVGEEMHNLGLTNEMLAGKIIFDIMDQEVAEFVAGNYRRALEGETVHFETSYNGQFYFAHAVPLRDEQENVTQILALSMNATEQKRSEQLLRETHVELERLLNESDQSRQALLNVVEDQKKAEEKIRQLNAKLEQRVQERTAQLVAANKELEAFSYSVSHDLRAPLRGIDGWSLALLEDYNDRLDERGRQYLDRVRTETQRMGNLIDDLLQLSRVTLFEMKRGTINLSDMARSISDRLTEENPQRQVQLIIQPGLTALGDANLIEVVLTNLLSNAYKFTRYQPLPIIEFGNIIIDGETAFFVRDNGAGFDMAYAKKLFGAFQRMHKQSEFPGTGIGLATVQRIILRHGGKTWAEAKKNLGATFYFTLGDEK